MKTKFHLLAGCTLIACIAGCSEEPVGEEIPSRAAQLTPSDEKALSDSNTNALGVADDQTSPDATREFDGKLRLTIPDSWSEVEMTAMQRSVLMAKYQMDGDVEISVSSARGGIDANFARWDGQFTAKEKDEDNVDFDSATARLLILSGDFSPGFGRPDRSDWMMLGAAFPAVPEDFYVKLTGPADRVKEIESEFRKMIGTAKFIN